MSDRSDIKARTSDSAELFAALGDPTRLAIVRALSEGPACVCDLADEVGISQSGVSHQLRHLRDMGFVTGRKRGRHVEYTLSRDATTRLLEQAKELVPSGDPARGAFEGGERCG